MEDTEMPDRYGAEDGMTDNVLGHSLTDTRPRDEAYCESIFEDNMAKHIITTEESRSRLFDDNMGDPIVVEDHDEETLAERNINAFHTYVNVERLANGAGLPLSKQLFVATWKKDTAEASRLTQAIPRHYQRHPAFETCIIAALEDFARKGGFSKEDMTTKAFLNEAEQMARNCAYIRAAEEMEKRALDEPVPPALKPPATPDLNSNGTNENISRQPVTRAEIHDFGAGAPISGAGWTWTDESNVHPQRVHALMSTMAEAEPAAGMATHESPTDSRPQPPQRTKIGLTTDAKDEGVTVAQILKTKRAIKDVRAKIRASKVAKMHTDRDAIAAQAGWAKVYVGKRKDRGGAKNRPRYIHPVTGRLHKGTAMEKRVSKQDNNLQPGTPPKRDYNLRSKGRSTAAPWADAIPQAMGSASFEPTASPALDPTAAQTAELSAPELLPDFGMQSTRDDPATIEDAGGVTPEPSGTVSPMIMEPMNKSHCEMEANADGGEIGANQFIRQTSASMTPQAERTKGEGDMLELVPRKQDVPNFSLNKAHQGYQHFKQAAAGEAVDWQREPCHKGGQEIWANHMLQQTSRRESLAVQRAKRDEVQLFYQGYQHFDRARDGVSNDWQHEPYPQMIGSMSHIRSTATRNGLTMLFSKPLSDSHCL